MKRFYGYTLTIKGLGYVNQEEAKVVCFIYDSYLQRCSLGGISKLLHQREIRSPTGNEIWGRAAIDKMLSNPKYVHFIVDAEVYKAVQAEKTRRTNMDTSSDTFERKSTHYSSKQSRAISSRGGKIVQFF